MTLNFTGTHEYATFDDHLKQQVDRMSKDRQTIMQNARECDVANKRQYDKVSNEHLRLETMSSTIKWLSLGKTIQS
jgi:hypothetical protein